MMELPYWTDLVNDPTIIWRACLAFGFGYLVGRAILYTVDCLGWPRRIAEVRKVKS